MSDKWWIQKSGRLESPQFQPPLWLQQKGGLVADMEHFVHYAGLAGIFANQVDDD